MRQQAESLSTSVQRLPDRLSSYNVNAPRPGPVTGETSLAAARSAFADPETEVSMAEISRRAGVGMATLYRNFPGRQELLEALYTDEVNAICEAAEAVGGETPGAVLTAWLHRFFAFATSKRHIASELLKHTDYSNPLFA